MAGRKGAVTRGDNRGNLPFSHLKLDFVYFPSGLVVAEPACQCREIRVAIPGPEDPIYATKQISPSARTLRLFCRAQGTPNY